MEMLLEKPSAELEATQRVLQLAMPERRGANHQRAIGDGFRERLVLFGVPENLLRMDSRAGFLEGDVVGIHQPQAAKSEIVNGAGRSSDIQWIARRDQNDS